LNPSPVKLFLDDKTTPPSDDWAISHTYEEAKSFVLENGAPRIISFGYELGVDENDNPLPNCFDFAKWLIQADMSGEITLPTGFTFKVHEENPNELGQISKILKEYLDFRDDGCNM
jgi:hypothetical protein